MNIVCASSVLFGKEAFSSIGNVTIIPDREIDNKHLRDVDVLVTRSKTDINQELLADTRVQFAGTATAGMDHMDTAFLDEADIAWTAAPGCNANSVAEYITSSLLCLAQRNGLSLPDMTLGVVGVGEVGSRVVGKARILGMNVLQNDPPKRAAGENGDWISLSEVLRGSDIVTLHVPLTHTGAYATHRLADYLFFEQIKPGSIFINSSRGEVQDEEALLLCLDKDVISHAVLDVWQEEPYFSNVTLNQVDLGTPHIAGYSYEGRLKGTMMVYRQVCRFMEVEPFWSPENLLLQPDPIDMDAGNRSADEVLYELVCRAYDVEWDDQNLRKGATGDATARAAHFVSLRVNYPVRHEFTSYRVRLHNAPAELVKQVSDLGFQVIDV